MENEKNKKSTVSFEVAFNRLEEIARMLEDSSTPLEKSFDLYEEGQKLVRDCQNILDGAEKRLKIIKVNAEGYDIEEIDIE